MKDVTKFNEVDAQTDQQQHLLAFLDYANAHPLVLAWRNRMLGLLDLRAGNAVLDVGCGEGHDTRAMYPLVRPGGRIVGADLSDFLLGIAAGRAAAQKKAIEYFNANVMDLPFADATFDCVRAERLLMHVPDAPKAIAEMCRVLKPGGRLVILDFDWDTLAFDADDTDFARLVIRTFSDSVKTGLIGRSLRAMLRDAGLPDVQVRLEVVEFDWEMFKRMMASIQRFVEEGKLPASMIEPFWVDQEARMASGRFFSAVMCVTALGVK